MVSTRKAVKLVLLTTFAYFALNIKNINNIFQDYITNNNKPKLSSFNERNTTKASLERDTKPPEKSTITNKKSFNIKPDSNKTFQSKFHVQREYNPAINCKRIVDEKNISDIEWADKLVSEYRDFRDHKVSKKKSVLSKEYLEDLMMIPDENYIFNESRCEEFINIRGYNNYSVSDEEKAFPLAFSILTYEQAEQFERLLHAIYRPQNVYCIHVDSKSPAKFHQAIKSITRCFPNVFIATKLERVIWGGYSRLVADINCMTDLLMAAPESKLPDDFKTQVNIDKFWSHENMKNKKFRNDWKYLFNLASTEFPLKTNHELVQIMKIYNGKNDIRMIRFPDHLRSRIDYKWGLNSKKDQMIQTNNLKQPLTNLNYTLAKSTTYASFSRAFIEYVLYNLEPKILLQWLEDTFSSDETYWATLQISTYYNPPGSFKNLSKENVFPHFSRWVGWYGEYKCAGYIRQGICMITHGDLYHVTHQPNFFLNKFQLKDDPLAYACIEDWYYRRLQHNQHLISIGEKYLVDMTPYCKHLYKMSNGTVYAGCESLKY